MLHSVPRLECPGELRNLRDVLISAPAQAHDDRARPGPGVALTEKVSDRVRTFERWDDAFEARELLERIERLSVRYAGIRRAAGILIGGVFRTHTRIVQTRGDGVRGRHLPMFVLEKVGERPVKHTRAAGGQSRRMPSARHTL